MRDSLKSMLTPIVIISALVTVGLDIPIARQIISFVCISFVPGILILRILRLNLRSRVDTILFSAGLSVAFLMFVGLLVNELYPLIGVSKPLSTIPLLVTIGTILLAMFFISHIREGLARACSLPSPSQFLRASLLIGVPLLAIFGALLTDSFVLLLMVAVISLLAILTIFSKRLIPSELISFVVLVIAVSLLFHWELISKYFVGWDVFTEDYVFKLTASNSLWKANIPTTDSGVLNVNAMLSVTILPTIYSSLLNIQGEWVFKVICPLLFSLVPISLYQTYQQRFGKLIAFLSAFYFILFPRFYTLGSTRQMIGELFFVLLILLMVCKEISPRKRQMLLIIFGASLVVSHYSLAYIYLFFISFTWFFMSLIQKYKPTKWNPGTRKIISGGFVLLFFIMTFSWYVYISIYPFNTLLDLIDRIFSFFLTDFLNPRARGETISEFISPSEFASFSFAHKVDALLNKFTYFFIPIGIIDFFKNYKERKFEWEYALMVAANASILFMALVIPYLAPAFRADRLYHVTLLFLAPLCVLGGKMFFKWVLKPFKNVVHARHINLRLVCVFLVIIFLFTVGFIFEVIGDVPESTSISFIRMKTSNDHRIKARFYMSYIPEQDVISATWLSKVAANSKIYADLIAREKVLRSYGMIISKYILSNDSRIESDAYIFLRYLNVVDGILIERRGLGFRGERLSNITEFSHIFNSINKIYSNGASEIYRSLPSGQ